MTDLEKFRIRWYRWLGQKCRVDKPYWTTLLNSNWCGWATNILIERGYDLPSAPQTREEVKKYFKVAIRESDMIDLFRLDNLYCIEKIER